MRTLECGHNLIAVPHFTYINTAELFRLSPQHVSRRVAVGEDCFEIWRVAANKQSWTADKGWPLSFGVGRWAIESSEWNIPCYENLTDHSCCAKVMLMKVHIFKFCIIIPTLRILHTVIFIVTMGWDYVSVELLPRLYIREYGAAVERYWQEKTEGLWVKTVPVSLLSPQIPHGLPWERTRSSSVKSRWQTACTMTQPSCMVLCMLARS
jgi:hypothetical protein